jgi:probable HAF family extracellular repeat protein
MKVAVFLLISVNLSASTIYSVTNLGGLGGSSSAATGINNSGEVIGWAQTPDGDQHAFASLNGGPLTDLSSSISPWSSANGINSSGSIVGTAYVNGVPHGILWTTSGFTDLGVGNDAAGISDSGVIIGNNGHAFKFVNGVYEDLGTLEGGKSSSAAGINSNGTIVGDSTLASGAMRGFIWTPSTGMVEVDTFGGRDSHATGVNNSGEVIGTASLASGYQHAFLMVNGVMTDLGTLGGRGSYAYGINDAGSVVGYSWLAAGDTTHAFLWSNGALLDLNNLIPTGSGWVLTEAYGINASDQIVGTGTYNGQSQAFLLNLQTASIESPAVSPAAVPDVGTELLVGFGLAMILFMHFGRCRGINEHARN